MKNISTYMHNNTLSYNSYYAHIKPKNLQLYKDIYDKINFVKELEKGDSVFFDSSSTIPRYKFNNYCEDKGIKRTILRKKATVIVVNPDKFSPLTSLNKTQPFYLYTGKEIKDFCKINNLICNNIVDEEELVINTRTINNYNYSRTGNQSTNLILPDVTKIDLYVSYQENIQNILNEFLKNEEYTTLKFITDDDLNKLMGSEGLVIDEEYFKEITKMLESSDTGNIKIALEIIANSNYEKNIFPISIILNTFRDKITNLLKESVNLKNFTNYFKEVQWQQSTTNFLYSLRKELINKNDLTEEKKNYLDTAMLSYINSVLKSYKVSTNTFNWE